MVVFDISPDAAYWQHVQNDFESFPEFTLLQAFADLRQLLLSLGFEMKVMPGCIVFEHSPAHTQLVLEPLGDGDSVDPATLAIVGRNLDEHGILSRADFEELLQKHPLAG